MAGCIKWRHVISECLVDIETLCKTGKVTGMFYQTHENLPIRLKHLEERNFLNKLTWRRKKRRTDEELFDRYKLVVAARNFHYENFNK